MKSSNGQGGRIILLNDGVELSQAERERQAYATLDRLEVLQPSGAAPLTDEDLAIFNSAMERKGDEFVLYAQAAYADYCYFYIAAVTDAREDAMRKLQ